MKKQNPYKRAIEIVTSDNVNWKALVIKMAQDAPATLCKAYDSTNQNDDLHRAIRAELRSGRKIEAIKLYKGETGLGLREAKEYIDKIAEEMGY